MIERKIMLFSDYYSCLVIKEKEIEVIEYILL